MKSVLFRADGSKEIGMGHIVRCLALADELKNNNPDLEVVFITKYEEGKKIIEEKNYKVILATDDGIIQIRNLADEDTLLITDFLDTDNSYISEIKKITGLKVISIDNNTKLKRIGTDIVINANVFDVGEKKIISSTRYFLGPKYMILRKEFEEAHKKPFFQKESFSKETLYFSKNKKIKDKVETILVIFGGTDPGGYTIKVADALKNIHVHINLILGPGFSYSNNLNEVLSKTNGKFDLIVNPKNIIEIMKNADMAITAAGIALYELATLGIPSIAIPQAKHQEDIANAFENFGACINLGVSPDSKLISESTIRLMENELLREQLSENAKIFVDGKGIERVIKLIEGEVLK